ncbi:MAG: VPLPA-CTERM sorting domain-containing protein [Gammaproteobacteria bacterium]|nr:VPLPA-CTERM sorting domain-containing protein [Gammaproteobacteria bacterium]
MKCLKFPGAVVCVFFAHVSSSQAAPVAIDSMFVDSASFSVTVNSYSLYNFSRNFSPVEISMGEYQDPLLRLTSGIKYLDIYTTGSYGASSPSGFVDGTTINVDLSSLRVELGIKKLGAMFDVGLWPINTPSDIGVYDPLTGNYNLSWIQNFMVDNPGTNNDYYGNFTVQLGGYVTTSAVPVPAAFWLLGSGLIALAGVVRRKQ